MRKIAHEKGIPKHDGHRNGRKNRRHQRISQASIHGVLGLQKRNGKRHNGGGAHELSGVEEDGGEDSDEPDGLACQRQFIPCCAWSCGNPSAISTHYKATYYSGRPEDTSLDMLLKLTSSSILQIEGQMGQVDGCRGIRA